MRCRLHCCLLLLGVRHLRDKLEQKVVSPLRPLMLPESTACTLRPRSARILNLTPISFCPCCPAACRTAVVVEHCHQWGGEQRLRIRIALDTAGGAEGACGVRAYVAAPYGAQPRAL